MSRVNDVFNYLISDYSIANIDGETCIRRKISNKYDIEISGLSNVSKTFSVNIYVWELSNNTSYNCKVVEVVNNINSKELLKSKLDELFVKYYQLSRHSI